jgi:hypothetical protein
VRQHGEFEKFCISAFDLLLGRGMIRPYGFC